MISQVQTLLLIFQVILAFCNVCIMGYVFVKFINKPHDTLEEKHNLLVKRVDAHDVKLEEITKSLNHGEDNFRSQKDLNEVFINCMLAFIDFEMAYCTATGYKDIDDLETAKDTLRKYLARQK